MVPVHNSVPGSAGNVVQAGSIEGGVHLHTTSRPELPTPRQLPVLTDGFAGRSAQLGELDRLLTGDSRAEAVVISAIDGAAGIGKTTLAVRWSHQAADRFPDGQLYVNLRGFEPTAEPAAPAEALRGFLAALRVPTEAVPADQEAQSALYRSILADRRMLVLLDNARDVAQVRPLLPGSPTCAVLVTSRNRLTGLVALNGARLINLDVLTPAEARSLLARRLGPERVAAEPEAIASLLRSCAGFPLALAITAARAAADPGLSLRTLAAELRVEDDRLAALDAGDPHANLESVFSWSYRSLTPGAASLFRRLGTQPGPDVGFEAVQVLADVSAPEARKLIDELTRANLADQYVPGRYRLHDLLRLYAKRHAGEKDFAAARRTLVWFRDRVAAATSWLDPGLAAERHFRNSSDAMCWLELEEGNLVAAIVEGDEPELACLMSPFFRQRRNFDDWERTLTAALGDPLVRIQLHLAKAVSYAGDEHSAGDLQSLVAQLDPSDQAAALRHLADAHRESGRMQLAQETALAALAVTRQLGDRRAEACGLLLLSEIQDYQLLFDETADSLRQALEIWRYLGDSWFEADALVRRAQADRNRSHVTDALDCLDQALAIYNVFEDPTSVARTTSLLGSILGQYGAAALAHEAHRAALRTLADAGAPHEELSVLRELIRAARAEGDYAACEKYLTRRTAVARALGDPKLTIQALVSRGVFYSFTGNHEQAVALLREQREAARGLRVEVEGWALESLGLAHAEQGQFAKAADYLEEYEKLTVNHGNLRETALSRLVSLYRDSGRYADAVICSQSLLELCTQQGNPGATCNALDTLGDTHAEIGNYQDAILAFERSLTIRSEMGTDSYRRGWCLVHIADAHRASGRFEDTLTCLERALQLREQAGTRYGVTQVAAMIAGEHVARRDFARVRPFFEFLLGSSTAFPNPAVEGLITLARSYANQYRFEEAGRCFEHSLASLEEVGDRRLELYVRRVAAEAKVDEGRSTEALDLLRACLDHATAIGDFTNAGSLRGQVVSTLIDLRRFAEAAVDARHGLVVAGSVDSDIDRVRFLRLLGKIDHERGRHDQARWAFTAAATLCARNGDPLQSAILAALGKTHLRAGGLRQAVAAGKTRLELELAGGDRRETALAFAELARAHAGLDRTKAVELLDESFARSQELEDPWCAASNFGECADVAHELGDFERAERAFAEQRELNRRLFDFAGFAESLAKLAEHRRGTGDLAGAIDLHEQSLRTREELGDPPGIADQLRRLGVATAGLSRFADAIALLHESRDRARELGDTARLADAERTLATVHHRDGNTAIATQCLERARARYRQLGDDESLRSSVLA
ncbi:tetratricopeptide repeat protein [Amycolatopsis sp. NPDC049252]|uniref:tetratricopeptide repeat protein n=1 Tax=Amycolatopsis sp. NPDC049252 TaxID=3363933 RepID=UPI003718DAEA